MRNIQRFAFVRRGRSWVPSPLAGEGQGEGKSSGNESTHPNEKCCKLRKKRRQGRVLRLRRSAATLSTNGKSPCCCSPPVRPERSGAKSKGANSWNHR